MRVKLAHEAERTPTRVRYCLLVGVADDKFAQKSGTAGTFFRRVPNPTTIRCGRYRSSCRAGRLLGMPSVCAG